MDFISNCEQKRSLTPPSKVPLRQREKEPRQLGVCKTRKTGHHAGDYYTDWNTSAAGGNIRVECSSDSNLITSEWDSHTEGGKATGLSQGTLENNVLFGCQKTKLTVLHTNIALDSVDPFPL